MKCILNVIVFFLAYYFSFPQICFAKDIDNIAAKLTAIEKQIKKLQSNSPKCKNLRDVSCLQQKINHFCEIDHYLRDSTLNILVALSDKIIEEEPNCKIANKLYEDVDNASTSFMKRVVEIHGWPIISKFGKKADSQAWLLVQHADRDVFFQAEMVVMLENLALLGETSPKHVAYLHDRVAMNLADKYPHIKFKQQYGTQNMINNGYSTLYSYHGTLKEVNAKRKKFGLTPIREVTKKFEHKKESEYLDN